jgi:hypothetical protein
MYLPQEKESLQQHTCNYDKMFESEIHKKENLEVANG